MNRGPAGFPPPAETRPANILEQLVAIFESQGWLNRQIRITHRSRRYRISCDESGFLAYRINDRCGLSPGFPGWPVCVITPESIIHDSAMSAFPSTEPSAHEWLRCIADNDFELLSEVC